MDSFYSEEELANLGFKSIGKNVLISRKASIYGISRISIGNNVRIDDFSFVSAGAGGIQIGNFVHIALYVSFQGAGKITLEDFSGVSTRVSIYSSNDDYTGEFMSNPTVPFDFKGVITGDIRIGRHVLVGNGSVILPGVTIGEGAVIAALSLVDKDCEDFYIYKGNPARKIVKRSRDLLKLEKEFLKTLKSK
jgi:acetyltransferase-like isoleucine patch superfamily enzyme